MPHATVERSPAPHRAKARRGSKCSGGSRTFGFELPDAAPLAHTDFSRLGAGGTAGLFNCRFGLDVFVAR